MNTLRIAAALLLILAAACSAPPTAPEIDPSATTAQMDGQGLLGGGTRSAP